MKVIMVCSELTCNNVPFEATVGNISHTYCCEKGFEESLKAFTEFLGKNGTQQFDN